MKEFFKSTLSLIALLFLIPIMAIVFGILVLAFFVVGGIDAVSNQVPKIKDKFISELEKALYEKKKRE